MTDDNLSPRGPLGSKPRLSDWHDLPIDEQSVDFIIPRIREDLPLNLDPFLLFNSDKVEYQALHSDLLDFMERVRVAALSERFDDAFRLLEGISEPVELGLGYSTKGKKGRAFGPKIRRDIVALFASVPQLLNSGLSHVEVLSLLVENVAEDRISDLTASVCRQFLASFSRDQAQKHGLPTRRFHLDGFWDAAKSRWRPLAVDLPFNPESEFPLLLAPRDLLRTLPFINYADYYASVYAPLVLSQQTKGVRPKPAVLEHNRAQYSLVQQYISDKESRSDDCAPRDLFRPLAKPTLAAKISEIDRLPSGRDDGADKRYEKLVEDVLKSALWPELDFAEGQSRTVSGAHIRDLIFYNDAKNPFTADLRRRYGARQIVFELKNVKTISGEHTNQLARYLIDAFGKFGVLVTRNPLSKAMRQNLADLHSAHGKMIVCITDSDLRDMMECVDTTRRPYEILKRACISFERSLPN